MQRGALVIAGTELLYKPLNPAPQEVIPGAEAYPRRMLKPSQQEPGAAPAAATTTEGAPAAERPQQSPEERAAAMAAAERAVAPPAIEDIPISVSDDLAHTCLAPAEAGSAENGVLDNGHKVERKEVSFPRDATAPECAEEAAPVESAPAQQNRPVGTAIPAAEPAQPSQDTPVVSDVPNVSAAVPRDEAVVQTMAVATVADTAGAQPEADAKQADSLAGSEPGKKRSRMADEAGPVQAPSEEAIAAEEATAASEPAAPEGEASRKRRRVAAAAEDAPDAGEKAAAVEVIEPDAQAAVPKPMRRRKAASADLEAVQAAGTASTTPESQPSKTLSRRSRRSNHVAQDAAAPGEPSGSVSKPAPGAETNPGTAKSKAKPRRKGAAAEAAALEQEDVVPTDSPRHASSAHQQPSRRALRSQTAEPEPAATPRAGQPAAAASQRALRSQSSMPKDEMLSREGSRGGTAAASPEKHGMLQGSGQPGLGSVSGSAAVQRLLRRSLSPRRRTRSNAQEHSAAADLVAGGCIALL